MSQQTAALITSVRESRQLSDYAIYVLRSNISFCLMEETILHQGSQVRLLQLKSRERWEQLVHDQLPESFAPVTIL